MSRVLSIDYGKIRVGMACTDVLRISINPLPTVANLSCYDVIAKLIHTENIGHIVIGYPTHSDGKPSKITKDIDKLVKRIKIEFENIEISKIDEAYTSKDARQLLVDIGKTKSYRSKKENIDQVSAMLILKQYLEQFQ